jgi:hypothetical protein
VAHVTPASAATVAASMRAGSPLAPTFTCSTVNRELFFVIVASMIPPIGWLTNLLCRHNTNVSGTNRRTSCQFFVNRARSSWGFTSMNRSRARNPRIPSAFVPDNK